MLHINAAKAVAGVLQHVSEKTCWKWQDGIVLSIKSKNTWSAHIKSVTHRAGNDRFPPRNLIIVEHCVYNYKLYYTFVQKLVTPLMYSE